MTNKDIEGCFDVKKMLRHVDTILLDLVFDLCIHRQFLRGLLFYHEVVRMYYMDNAATTVKSHSV